MKVGFFLCFKKQKNTPFFLHFYYQFFHFHCCLLIFFIKETKKSHDILLSCSQWMRLLPGKFYFKYFYDYLKSFVEVLSTDQFHVIKGRLSTQCLSHSLGAGQICCCFVLYYFIHSKCFAKLKKIKIELLLK